MYRIWNDKDAQWRLTDDCSWPAEPIYTIPPNPKSQPEQEPVAIYRAGQANGEPFHVGFFKAMNADEVLLYTAPPLPVQPEQKPVAPTCERCGDEIVESNAGLCANCLPAICTEQEPVFKWCSVFQEMPTADSYLLFCFGVHVVEGSYTKKGWASLAYGEAQPDFWAYMPPAPHPKRNQELYAMPLQRPWVGLTAQEAADCWTTSATKTWHNFEAALRSKNI